MAYVNFAKRRVEMQVVYVGSSGSGRLSNMAALSALPCATKEPLNRNSPLVSLTAPKDVPRIGGMQANLSCWFVPIDKDYCTLAIGAIDVAVFVADSRLDRRQKNRDVLALLKGRIEGLDSRGLWWAKGKVAFEDLPIVVQANHSDVTTALEPEAILEDLGLDSRAIVIPAVASHCEGVVATLRAAHQRAHEGMERYFSGGYDTIASPTTFSWRDEEAYLATDAGRRRAFSAYLRACASDDPSALLELVANVEAHPPRAHLARGPELEIVRFYLAPSAELAQNLERSLPHDVQFAEVRRDVDAYLARVLSSGGPVVEKRQSGRQR